MVRSPQMWVFKVKKAVSFEHAETHNFLRCFTAVSCPFKVPFKGPQILNASLKVLRCSWNFSFRGKLFPSINDSDQEEETPAVRCF